MGESYDPDVASMHLQMMNYEPPMGKYNANDECWLLHRVNLVALMAPPTGEKYNPNDEQ